MPDEITNSEIVERALGPKSATAADGSSVTDRDMAELQAARDLLAQDAAAQTTHFGLRSAQLVTQRPL